MKVQEQTGLKGTLWIRTYDKQGNLLRTQMEDNLVVNSSGHGRNLVVRQLGGDTTYGIEIDAGAIGDDDTTPTDSDTDLANAVVSSISPSAKVVSNDTVTVQYFLTDASLPDGTYKEFGNFIGSQLFSRAVFSSNYSKSSGEDTRIDYQIKLDA